MINSLISGCKGTVSWQIYKITIHFLSFKIDLCEKIWIFPQIAVPLHTEN